LVSSFYLIGALLALVGGAFLFYFNGVYMGFFPGAQLLIPAPAGPNINNYEVAGGRPIFFIMIVAGGKEGNAINSIAINKFSPAP
jgi:hypothetical protein